MSKHKHPITHEKVEETSGTPVASEGVKENKTPIADVEPLVATEEEVLAPVPSPEQIELAVMKDRYARLMADFDNFRKRQNREREEWFKRANETLLEDFLPIVDHLELALGKNPDLTNPFVSGVKMVYDQFVSVLEKHSVTPIDAKGQPFNPDWHEALSQIPSDTVPANEVIEQFRRGWCLGGRLMRPAQVIVSSGKSEPLTI